MCNSLFCFIAEQYCTLRIYQSLFIHSLFGHLGCFQFGITVNKTAMNVLECLGGSVHSFLFNIYFSVGMLDHWAGLGIIFINTAK